MDRRHGSELRGLAGERLDKGVFAPSQRFGRLFPHLRSLKLDQLNVSVEVLGGVGGPMDAGTDIVENPRIPAGFTFLGQFIDHDITFDPTSSMEQQNDPEAIRNFRTPAFELDSVYGAGPAAQPYLYERPKDVGKAGKLLTSSDGGDHLRNPKGTAIIGDPRNDENLIVAQLHNAFVRFHNSVWEHHTNKNFEEAQRLVRWHYQWIVLHEFLPLTVGEEVVADVLHNGLKHFRLDGSLSMPVEFSVAAYRFGHSQVRGRYVIQTGQNPLVLFSAEPDDEKAEDLRGSRPIPPAKRVEWGRFFGESATRSMAIDTKLSTPLLGLPNSVVDSETTMRSLAVRNLSRGFAFALPSGQTVARFMGIPELADEELWDGVEGGAGEAPLWFYILREAEKRANGEHLYGVGARIVAEVFIGLLLADRASYLNQFPGWTPDLPSENPRDFRMTDLITIASQA